MRSLPRLFLVGIIALAAAGSDAAGQDAAAVRRQWDEFLSSLTWTDGPATIALGAIASVEIPAGTRALGQEDARRLLEVMGNASSRELALVSTSDIDWIVDFSFEPIGRVDDGGTLDEEALLATLREAADGANAFREMQGLAPLGVDGFEIAPTYDRENGILSWAVRLTGPDGDPVYNYQARVLGRRGVIVATFACEPAAFRAEVERAAAIVGSLRFAEGARRDDFVPGEPVSGVDLAGLVTGLAHEAPPAEAPVDEDGAEVGDDDSRKLLVLGIAIAVAVLGAGAWRFGRRGGRASTRS
ncbi:MAG: DUF2167 domain-containing protein [Planctomycetota bacterium]